MTGLFLGQDEIEALPRRLDQPFAARVHSRIHRALELDREAFLTGSRPYPEGGDRAVALHELAICSRLGGTWHREAADRLLSTATDLATFMGVLHDATTGRALGLNPLMVANASRRLCQALDFLPDLSADLRGQLVERVLLPAADLIENTRRGGSNWQSNLNLALLYLALATGEHRYLATVVDDPTRSYAFQLDQGVDEDGFWYEQCPASYHLGTAERLMETRWIARRHNLPLEGDPILQSMVDNVAGMAMPGAVLPRIGDVDTDRPSTIYRVRLLELAYALFGTPWVGWALDRSPRDDLYSLLIGRDVTAAVAPDPVSHVFASTGLAVLRQGDRDGYWEGEGAAATITFGAHGDWHGHAGKLGIEYRHRDAYLARDSGISHGYGLPIHRHWFMTTVAHSTVVVDGHNQSFTFSHDRPDLERLERGACHASLINDEVSACTVSADFAYPAAHVRRTLFLRPDYLLDITECTSRDGTPRTFDWVLHTGGLIAGDLPFAHASLGYYRHGYDYIREVEAAATDDDWSVEVMNCYYSADLWTATDQAMRLRLCACPGTTVFRGVAPAPARDAYDPLVVVRRQASHTVFIALHVPGDRPLELSCIRQEAGAIVCRVTSETTVDTLAKQDVPGAIELDGQPVSDLLAFISRKGPATVDKRQGTG